MQETCLAFTDTFCTQVWGTPTSIIKKSHPAIWAQGVRGFHYWSVAGAKVKMILEVCRLFAPQKVDSSCFIISMCPCDVGSYPCDVGSKTLWTTLPRHQILAANDTCSPWRTGFCLLTGWQWYSCAPPTPENQKYTENPPAWKETTIVSANCFLGPNCGWGLKFLRLDHIFSNMFNVTPPKTKMFLKKGPFQKENRLPSSDLSEDMWVFEGVGDSDIKGLNSAMGLPPVPYPTPVWWASVPSCSGGLDWGNTAACAVWDRVRAYRISTQPVNNLKSSELPHPLPSRGYSLTVLQSNLYVAPMFERNWRSSSWGVGAMDAVICREHYTRYRCPKCHGVNFDEFPTFT